MIAEWQSRPLDRVYPIIFLDAIHFKVRKENRIVNKAAYSVLGINMSGQKDILGIWIGENESASFWLGVCKEQKELMADLKQVYQALTMEEAELGFEIFKEKWSKKHPIIIRSWENNWLELTAYFKYPYEIRKIIYTTNVIKGYHRQLRKVTKTKTAYPTDEALKKIIYLATVEASKKWTMPIKEWKKCISQFAIHFGDRLQSELGI